MKRHIVVDSKIILLSCILIYIFIPNISSAKEVDGKSLFSVIYQDGEAVGFGSFSHLGNGNWFQKHTKNGKRYDYKFRELNRDKWSVYLQDKNNKNTQVQLDLYTKKVNRKYTGQNYVNLYRINEVNRVTGYLVHNVIYNNGSGSFSHAGDGRWIEKNKGNRYYFIETNRDEWSVYLKRTDGARIVLDLYTKKVRYKKGNENYRNIYSITSANDKDLKIVTLDDARAIDNRSNCELIKMNEGVNAVDKTGRMVLKACTDNGEVTIETLLVECSIIGSPNNKGNADCNFTGFDDNISLYTNNGEVTLNAAALSSSACVGAKEQGVCYNAGVDLLSVSGGYFDKNGRGISLSAGIGLGAGGSFYFEDDTMVMGFNAFGLGVTIKTPIPSIATEEGIGCTDLGCMPTCATWPSCDTGLDFY